MKKCLNCQKEIIRGTRLSYKQFRGRKFCSNKCRGLILRDERSGPWRGDKVKYRALHAWIEKRLGKASEKKCTLFETNYCTKKIDWSNVSGKYKRELSDWQPLCHRHNCRYNNRRKGK